MKILQAFHTGAIRSLRSSNIVLVVWFIYFLVVSILIFPLKGSLLSGFGNSMISELLVDGFDVEVFADLGNVTGIIVSFFRNGFFILILTGLILNAFITGGLFDSVRSSVERNSLLRFWRSSARYFWSFLVILIVMNLLILILFTLVVIIPVIVVSAGGSQSESAVMKTMIITGSIFLIILTINMLVADYARAWQVSNDRSRCFKAIGFGFGQTFRTLFSSWSLMIVLMIAQVLYMALVIYIIPGLTPVTSGGVFLLFLLSQIMFFVRIMLKIWRYGCVTSFMEQSLISKEL